MEMVRLRKQTQADSSQILHLAHTVPRNAVPLGKLSAGGQLYMYLRQRMNISF